MTHIEKQKVQQIAMAWSKAQPLVFSYIRSSVFNYHDAEDLLQKVASVMVEKYDQYDPARPFAAWVIGVARIEVLRHLSKTHRDKVVFEKLALDRITDAYISKVPKADTMREALEHCIETVQGKSKKVLQLRYGREEPTENIAELMGMSSNAVFVMLHRIRTALRDCIRSRLSGESAK